MKTSITIPVTFEFKTSKTSLEAGLRLNWMDAEDDDEAINLSCGAGVGSSFLIFSHTNKKTKATRYAVCDIQPAIRFLAAEMAKHNPTKAKP